jgi:hypothetical protein
MTSAEEQLAMIGFGRERRDTPCWRSVRLGSPVFRARGAEVAPDPANSRVLALWREVLAREPRPSPYRIRRVAGR